MNYSPTVRDLMEYFDRKDIVDWVVSNILCIWMLKPDSNPIIYQQALSWARLWLPMNKLYTVGELTLFFARCKAGRYDLGYKLDLTRLGNIFKKDFLAERSQEIEAYRSRFEAAERERQRQEDKEQAVSYDEYKKMNPDFDLSGKVKLLVKGKSPLSEDK